MTDETKYTPGPWRLEQGTTLVWGSCDPDDTSDRGMGYPIAECRITPISHLWAKGPDADEGEANALLMAAAPELLEALRAFMDKIDLACLVEKDHPQADLADEWRQGIAAIYKAEGRSE